MNLDALDLNEFGERVRALDGGDVYEATVQRALAIAIRNTVSAASPHTAEGAELQTQALSTDAVVASLRTEFLKLLRPH